MPPIREVRGRIRNRLYLNTKDYEFGMMLQDDIVTVSHGAEGESRKIERQLLGMMGTSCLSCVKNSSDYDGHESKVS